MFLVKKILYNNRQTRRKHDNSYYQPQPAVQNHRQQYCHDIINQQDSYQKDYDRGKGVAHGMIHSGIPTPGKQATPIILLEKDSYSRKKPTDSSSTFLSKGTSVLKN